MKYAGPYDKFTPELAERIRQEDKAEDRLLRGPSPVEVMLGAAKPQPVEDQFKVTSGQLSPRRAAAASPVIASLSRVMHPTSDGTTTVESEAGILADFVRGGASDQALLFAGSVPYRGGSILQFDVEEEGTKLILVAIERGAAGVDFYSFELEGWPHSPAEIRLIDDDGSGAQIGVSTVVGSGHFMTLRIFDPATGRLGTWATTSAMGGTVCCGSEGAYPLPSWSVKEATGASTPSMHCPARFVTALVRFEPSTRSYAAVAERRTATDVPAGAVNLFGLSPKMFYDRREEELFRKLGNHSPDYIASDLVKDVDAAVGFINARYCAAHEFSVAAQKY